MSEKAFSKIMRSLEEAQAYMKGEREGYAVAVPLSANGRGLLTENRVGLLVRAETGGMVTPEIVKELSKGDFG